MHHLEFEDDVRPSQLCFCTGRSCLTNLFGYVEYLTTKNDDRQSLDCVYLDYLKRFDEVLHKPFLLEGQRTRLVS